MQPIISLTITHILISHFEVPKRLRAAGVEEKVLPAEVQPDIVNILGGLPWLGLRGRGGLPGAEGDRCQRPMHLVGGDQGVDRDVGELNGVAGEGNWVRVLMGVDIP